MVFVFDLDDTLCDTDGYSEEYISNFFITHNLPYKQIVKDVRFAEAKFDWDFETANKWYKEFGDEMMLHFPTKPNVTEVLNKLHKQGHKIVIATARATDWHTKPEQITLQWLKNNHLPYDKVYIGRIDKEKICEEENADFFVDDDLNIVSRVAEYFRQNGRGKAFLSTSNFNKDLPVEDGIRRIDCIDEILSFSRAKAREKTKS